ncbi:MAG: hypothetical protein ABW051_01450 [Burkholderiaceae bacterium]
MQSAPSVSYPVGRSLLTAVLPASLWLGGALAAAAFAVAPSAPLAMRVAVASAALGAGLIAALAWRDSPRGLLHWDGLEWRLEGEGAACCGPATVGLDLQRLMLLRVGSARGARWAWAEARMQPYTWGDFRRAVYSRAINLPAPGASPSPAAA